MPTTTIESVLSHKKLGNVALDSNSYSIALKHYTEALNLLIENTINTTGSIEDSGNSNSGGGLKVNTLLSDSHLEASLYSKRSVAFLKLNHYYYAYEDAKQVIQIEPEWFKGYLRKGDVELHCGLYQDALKNFQLALRYLDVINDDNDLVSSSSSSFTRRRSSNNNLSITGYVDDYVVGDQQQQQLQQQKSTRHKCCHYERLIKQKISHILLMMQRDRSFDIQIPWIGAAFGLVVGMAIVTWDYVAYGKNSYIKHPIMKLACIGAVSYVFFHLANWQRTFAGRSKRELLMPPIKK